MENQGIKAGDLIRNKYADSKFTTYNKIYLCLKFKNNMCYFLFDNNIIDWEHYTWVEKVF